jgi:hypothetical protein
VPFRYLSVVRLVRRGHVFVIIFVPPISHANDFTIFIVIIINVPSYRPEMMKMTMMTIMVWGLCCISGHCGGSRRHFFRAGGSSSFSLPPL